MPSRNILKQDIAKSYYHVYARGSNRQDIFIDEADYIFFISLFKRYLSVDEAISKWGVYPHLYDNIELLTYCLMPNHFHLLLYQIEPRSMSNLMKSIMTSYSRYFNHKYDRSGPLFESRYKASHIDSDTYLQHISRYIHLNPRYWKKYPYSSLHYYLAEQSPEWLRPARITDLFNSATTYLDFLADYEEHKLMLDKIKSELADS